MTIHWNTGDQVRLIIKSISKESESSKLEHWFPGLSAFCQQVSASVYKRTLRLLLKGVYPLFHVSALQETNTIQQTAPKQGDVDS